MPKMTKGHFETLALGIHDAVIVGDLTQEEAEKMVDVLVPILREASALTPNGNRSFKEDLFRAWSIPFLPNLGRPDKECLSCHKGLCSGH